MHKRAKATPVNDHVDLSKSTAHGACRTLALFVFAAALASGKFFLRPWLPQGAALAHPHVKAAVSLQPVHQPRHWYVVQQYRIVFSSTGHPRRRLFFGLCGGRQTVRPVPFISSHRNSALKRVSSPIGPAYCPNKLIPLPPTFSSAPIR